MRPALRCLGLVLSLPAGAAAAQPAAVEMTVVFEGPAQAAVRTEIPPDHPFAGSEAFHVLAPSPETDWRRAPVRFARDPAGALLFRASARADAAGWVHVPVPLPDEAPEPGAEPVFAARITPPPGYRIADAFPALTADGEGVTLEAHLPAPPSLLRFRLVPEEGFAIGLATFVDGALALLLIGLGVFGARRLLAPSPPAGTSPP
ncbi:MAG: hypothetical protein OXH05_08580 [Acidobacteria bacterium]|nr:hypothetical protein [Acidobacteriota bacterium]